MSLTKQKLQNNKGELNLIFSKAHIGKLNAKNRIVVAPMGLFWQDCLVGIDLKPQIIDFYESLARGGGRDDDYQRVVLPSNDKRSEYHTTLCHVG